MRSTFTFLREAGCLFEPEMLAFLHERTNGDPCSGCNLKDGCPAYPKVLTVEREGLQTRIDEIRNARTKSAPLCPHCRSPLNLKKVARRGGRCACGALLEKGKG